MEKVLIYGQEIFSINFGAYEIFSSNPEDLILQAINLGMGLN